MDLNLDVLRHITRLADGPAVVATCSAVCKLWRQAAHAAWPSQAQKRWGLPGDWRPWAEWQAAGPDYCKRMYEARHKASGHLPPGAGRGDAGVPG